MSSVHPKSGTLEVSILCSCWLLFWIKGSEILIWIFLWRILSVFSLYLRIIIGLVVPDFTFSREICMLNFLSDTSFGTNILSFLPLGKEKFYLALFNYGQNLRNSWSGIGTFYDLRYYFWVVSSGNAWIGVQLLCFWCFLQKFCWLHQQFALGPMLHTAYMRWLGDWLRHIIGRYWSCWKLHFSAD